MYKGDGPSSGSMAQHRGQRLRLGYAIVSCLLDTDPKSSLCRAATWRRSLAARVCRRSPISCWIPFTPRLHEHIARSFVATASLPLTTAVEAAIPRIITPTLPAPAKPPPRARNGDGALARRLLCSAHLAWAKNGDILTLRVRGFRLEPTFISGGQWGPRAPPHSIADLPTYLISGGQWGPRANSQQ
eukprot:scaffold82084_cov31-Tisochrysis_lutea.AAC.3